MTNAHTPDPQSTPDTESGDAQPARYHVISDSPGIDNAEQWSERIEGKEYEVGILTIRRGRSTFTVGTRAAQHRRRPNRLCSGRHPSHIPHPWSGPV
jgi:hypothetical protein